MGANPTSEPVLKRQTMAIGTHYIAIPCFSAETVSIFLQWFDGDIAASGVTLQTTDDPDVDRDSTDDTDWTDESDSITGPGGTAAGCERVNVTNLGARRARLEVVLSAAGELQIWTHAKD